MRAQDIELFTVGVGSGVNEAELEAITNDVTRNIYVGDFDSLLEQAFVDAMFERIIGKYTFCIFSQFHETNDSRNHL